MVTVTAMVIVTDMDMAIRMIPIIVVKVLNNAKQNAAKYFQTKEHSVNVRNAKVNSVNSFAAPTHPA